MNIRRKPFQPAIKWSGSKRSQAWDIIDCFPRSIDTYYEPFCGGCSILRALLINKDIIQVERYVCSDLNGDLIGLWNAIKENPLGIATEYEQMWRELNADNDMERKKIYFGAIRSQFNKERLPAQFMFIMRTCTNGMPRYNADGDFNNSFHVTRNGMVPEMLAKVVSEWSRELNENNVEFVQRSYDAIKPAHCDFVYLDPPYANTKGMYYGALNNERLFDFLRELSCGYAMSFDGISGMNDNTYAVPSDVYSEHRYIVSGNSSFKRVIGKSKDSIVKESLYIR